MAAADAAKMRGLSDSLPFPQAQPVDERWGRDEDEAKIRADMLALVKPYVEMARERANGEVLYNGFDRFTDTLTFQAVNGHATVEQIEVVKDSIAFDVIEVLEGFAGALGNVLQRRRKQGTGIARPTAPVRDDLPVVDLRPEQK